MAMAVNDIERLIRARIPDAEVTIRDLAGDGDHYAATVIAESFPRQIESSATPDRIRGAQGRNGRQAACAGAADQHARAEQCLPVKSRSFSATPNVVGHAPRWRASGISLSAQLARRDLTLLA